MTFKLSLVSALTSLVLLVSSCGPKPDSSSFESNSENAHQSKLITSNQVENTFLSVWSEPDLSNTHHTIRVVDQMGRPVQQADILVGQARGVPFAGNFLKTDKSGEIRISKNDWKSNLHITAEAQGFVRQTLISQRPGNIVVKLNNAHLIEQPKIKGNVTGLPISNGDKFIDFGLVMSSLTKADLFNFDLGSVISPMSDTMSAMGQSFSVPSNTSIPKQKEKYIINITLDKPIYTFLTPQLGPKQVFVAAGRFEFKPAVDELRDGKPFYELINMFTMSGGTIRDVNVTGAETNLELPAREIEFKSKVSAKSPTILADEVFLALALNEVNGRFLPSAVRKLESNQTTELSIIGDRPVYVVNALKRKSEFLTDVPGNDRISLTFLPQNVSAQSQLLPLLENPQVSATDRITIRSAEVERPKQLTDLATSIAIADVFERTIENQKVTTLVRRWEIYSTGWTTDLQLPQWPIPKQIGAKNQRVEVNYLGGLTAPRLELGDELVNAVTHVTRASTEF